MSVDPDSGPLAAEFAAPVGRTIATQRRLAGLTGGQLAARTGMSQSKISRIETGRAIPTREEIATLAAALGLSAEANQRLLSRATLTSDVPAAVPPRPDDLALRQHEVAGMELSARSIREFSPYNVAGLLQTSEYARAVVVNFYTLLARDGADPDDAVVLESVARRLDRQRILADPERKFHLVMQESVLRNGICTPAQMLAQLQRIRDVAKRHDNVTIAFLPLNVTPPPGSPNFTVYDDGYVLLDLPHLPAVLSDTAGVSLYRRLFDRIEESATTDIDPILDKYIDLYYEQARPRRN